MIRLGSSIKSSKSLLYLHNPHLYSHEINQFCSKHSLQEVYINKFDTLDEQLAEALQRDADKWAPGIQIIAIRVTKPIIPEKLMKNYEEIES